MNTHIRQKCVVGNWKMHTTAFEAQRLAKGVVEGIANIDHVTVIVCPPFPYLALVREMLHGSSVLLGAQNMYPDRVGAFTGEVSPTMLLDLGCKYVILGHSERRQKLGESDGFINQKVRCALAAGLDVILCVGETLEQRKAKDTEALLDSQLREGLADVPVEALSGLSIAYEPVWAIGNLEHHATPQQAQDTHVIIRRKFGEIYGETWSQKLTISYGGSVEPQNAAAFLSQHDVDGVLIGGASLKAEEFLAIVGAGVTETQAKMQSA